MSPARAWARARHHCCGSRRSSCGWCHRVACSQTPSRQPSEEAHAATTWTATRARPKAMAKTPLNGCEDTIALLLDSEACHVRPFVRLLSRKDCDDIRLAHCIEATIEGTIRTQRHFHSCEAKLCNHSQSGSPPRAIAGLHPPPTMSPCSTPPWPAAHSCPLPHAWPAARNCARPRRQGLPRHGLLRAQARCLRLSRHDPCAPKQQASAATACCATACRASRALAASRWST